MNLSEHFTLAELTHSETAARLGIYNAPTEVVADHLRFLCAHVLEPLRNTLSRPIFVSSGFRCERLNAAVHGSPRSDHVQGYAADIVCPPLPVADLAQAVRRLAPFVPLKQCIIEFPESSGGGWVHVSALPSVDVDDYTPQFLIASIVDGQTQYTKWMA